MAGTCMMDGASFRTGLALAGFGAFLLANGVAALAAPARWRRAVLAFPRAKIPAWALAAIDTAWCCAIVMGAQLGRFAFLRPWVPLAGIAVFAAVVLFLDELLAPRAWGGLLLLVAQPVLMGVRWAETPWHLLVAVLMYVCVVWGGALMLHPWLFRAAAAPQVASDGRARAFGALRVLAGAVLAGIGVWVLCG